MLGVLFIKMNKKGMIHIAIVILVVIIVGAIIIGLKMTGNSVFGEDYKDDPIPYKISELSNLNLEDVDSFEKYKTFADNVNNLILILNDKLKTDIPLLEKTQEAWDKTSKTITKYSPLINNYNNVILSSKNFTLNPSQEKYQIVYKELGVFSLEFTFISATLFHTATFGTVGAFYRASGFNTFALKCPSCVSVMLSSAYWTIKTVLVEKASEGAKDIFDKLEDMVK